MPYLSKLGSSFLGLGFLMYLASMQSQSGLLFLVLGIVASCFVINAFGASWASSCLAIVPPCSVQGVEGQAVEGTWEVHNTSGHPTGMARVLGPWGEMFRVGALDPAETVHLTPELVFDRRGVYSFSALSLVSSYPFGLVRSRGHLPLQGEVVVYPAAYECPAPRAAGFEPMVGGKFAGRNRSASGDSFHGIRPIRPGDPVKLIHWASSAKGQGLMVREYDEELSGRVGIVLDAAKGAAPDGGPILDWAARACASLMLSALDAGHQVEFVDASTPTSLSVPPFSDGSTVLDHLARVEPNRTPLTPDDLDRCIRALPARAALALVLTSLDARLVEHIRTVLTGSGRLVTLYVPVTASGDGAADLSVFHYGPHSIEAIPNA